MYKNFHRIYLCECENKTVDNSKKLKEKNTGKTFTIFFSGEYLLLCVVVVFENYRRKPKEFESNV